MQSVKTSLWLMVCCVLITACNQKEPSKVRQNTAPVVATAKSADGVEIAYTSYGSGDMAVVLVHGWSCNQAYWREQIEVLKAAGYQTVTLDLASHGDSGRTREQWQVEGFGNDVKAVIEALKIKRAVVVGHSMGGLVALQAAKQMPNTIIGVIAADSLHDAEASYDPAQSDAMIQPFKNDFKASVADMFTFMTGSNATDELRNWIIEQGQQADPTAAIGLLYDYALLDSTAMFRNAGVPVRAINAAASQSQPPTMTERNKQYADFDATLIDGVGHFLQLEAPVKFNRALLQYLSELGQEAS